MHYTPLFLSATLVLPVVSRSVVVMPRNATAYSTTVADLHNSFRQRHNAPNLTWDETLANEAAATAGTCVFKIDSSGCLPLSLKYANTLPGVREQGITDRTSTRKAQLYLDQPTTRPPLSQMQSMGGIRRKRTLSPTTGWRLHHLMPTIWHSPR